MLSLGEKIKSLRRERKLTQMDVVTITGIGLRTLKYYESDKSQPTAEVIVKLCQLFQVSADFLLGLSENASFVCPFAPAEEAFASEVQAMPAAQEP